MTEKFILHEIFGVSDDDTSMIERELTELIGNSDLSIVEIAERMARGRNGADMLAGFKFAAFIYYNEGRLLPMGTKFEDVRDALRRSNTTFGLMPLR